MLCPIRKKDRTAPINCTSATPHPPHAASGHVPVAFTLSSPPLFRTPGERGRLVISDSPVLFLAFPGTHHHQLPPQMQPGRAGHGSLPFTPCDINGFADPNALELTAPDPGSPRTAILPSSLMAKLLGTLGAERQKWLCGLILPPRPEEVRRACVPTLS